MWIFGLKGLINMSTAIFGLLAAKLNAISDLIMIPH